MHEPKHSICKNLAIDPQGCTHSPAFRPVDLVDVPEEEDTVCLQALPHVGVAVSVEPSRLARFEACSGEENDDVCDHGLFW